MLEKSVIYSSVVVFKAKWEWNDSVVWDLWSFVIVRGGREKREEGEYGEKEQEKVRDILDSERE